MKATTKYFAPVLLLTLVSLAAPGCGNTMRGAKKDTEKIVEKTGAGVETMDVKAALIKDGRVDASNVNVDTSASTKTVLLKGSVPTAEQKSAAEMIAREQAKGYRIDNQLVVVPKQQ